jgi:shikimate kinase
MGHLWLTGTMGSGKTTVGRVVADRRSLRFYDTDGIVTRDAGESIADIFERDGEATFRKLEKRAVRLVANAPPGIVATGGGAVLDPGNVEVMRASGIIVFFDVDVVELAARLAGSEGRPLLIEGGGRQVRTILADREAAYRAAADAMVRGERSIDDAADEVEGLWNRS